MSPSPTVMHIPSDHVYARRITTGAPMVASDPWCPTGWHHRPDVVHLHFGYEHLTATELDRWCRQVRTRSALAVTIHDIDNPHLIDQAPHHDRIEVLVEHADALITLTPGAADEIARRWGRRPAVIAHPHVAPLAAIGEVPPVEASERPLIWLGTLRPNVDLGLVSLLTAGPDRFDVVVRSDLHHDRARRARLGIVLDHARRRGHTVSIIDRPTDRGLRGVLRSRPFVVLPYAWGTHSGFVELCHDLDVPTVVPPVGHHADQGAAPSVDPDRIQLRPRAGRAGRQRELDAIRSAHRRIYTGITRRSTTVPASRIVRASIGPVVAVWRSGGPFDGVRRYADAFIDARGSGSPTRAIDGDVHTSCEAVEAALGEATLVHAHVSDHALEAAATSLDLVIGQGRPTVLTIHDVPQPAEGSSRYERRRHRLVDLVARANVVEVLVSSEHERRLAAACGIDVAVLLHPVIPVPARVDRIVLPPRSVGVLGHIHPGKGVERLVDHVAAADASLVLIGSAPPHHADHLEAIVRRCRMLGVELVVTGALSDQAMIDHVGSVHAACMHHLHMSASGSLLTWLAAGRRVLTVPTPFVDEIRHHVGDRIVTVDGDWVSKLRAELADDPFERNFEAPDALHLACATERLEVLYRRSTSVSPS